MTLQFCRFTAPLVVSVVECSGVYWSVISEGSCNVVLVAVVVVVVERRGVEWNVV